MDPTKNLIGAKYDGPKVRKDKGGDMNFDEDVMTAGDQSTAPTNIAASLNDSENTQADQPVKKKKKKKKKPVLTPEQ